MLYADAASVQLKVRQMRLHVTERSMAAEGMKSAMAARQDGAPIR
jgi:hypothetical protein